MDGGIEHPYPSSPFDLVIDPAPWLVWSYAGGGPKETEWIAQRGALVISAQSLWDEIDRHGSPSPREA